MVIQEYAAEADNEYVIRGNAAIMKCEIPSYVSDFIVVDMWTDSDGGSYYPNEENYGTFAWPFTSQTILVVHPWCLEFMIFSLLLNGFHLKHTHTKNTNSLP